MKSAKPRQLLRLALTGLLVIPLSGLLQDYVGALAIKYGWIQSAVDWTGPAMSSLAAMSHSVWFWPFSYMLIGAVIAVWTVHFLPKGEVWTKEDVLLDLSLSVSGIATAKVCQNIHRWHLLPIGVMEVADAQGVLIQRTPSYSLLVLTYAKLVSFRQFHVELEGRAPPHFEVKDNHAYGCVIIIVGDMAGCLLKVRVEV